MSEIPRTQTTADFPGQAHAKRLGAALLVALSFVLILTLRDNARRSTLEVAVQSSAVGDTTYLRLPADPPPEPYPAVAALHGKPLYPTGYKRHGKREADLFRVAVDEATGLAIYQAPPKAKEEGLKDIEPTYFLKLGPGEFLKVRLTNRAE